MANELILVVDDSQEIRQFLKQYVLIPLGYNVLTAPDGQAGLETALENNPDLIILDMSMPRMTGLQMLDALRKASNQAPVIFMTMHGSERIAAEVFRLGVREYMVKPFTLDEVRSAIDRALYETRLEKEKEALSQQLVAAETVNRTVITLSHYLNSSMTIIQGGLRYLQEHFDQHPPQEAELNDVMQDCLESADKMEAVMRVLQNSGNIQEAVYHGSVRMIDIETALQEELNRKR